MNFNECVETVEFLFNLNKIPLLVGNPGIGKTAIPFKIGENLGIPVLQVIPVLMQEIEINGIPYLEGNKTFRSIPELLVLINEMVEEFGGCIFFIDEISRAPVPVQNALLNILHKKVIGTHKIPNCVKIILASNNPKDDKGSGRILTALEDRVSIQEFDGPTYEEWCSHEKDLNFIFKEFLKTKTYYFGGHKDSLNKKYISPRTLSAANKNFQSINVEDILTNKVFRNAMVGDIGFSETNNFLNYAEFVKNLYSMNDFLNNRDKIKIHTDYFLIDMQNQLLIAASLKSYFRTKDYSLLRDIIKYINLTYGEEYGCLAKEKTNEQLIKLTNATEAYKHMRNIFGNV